MHPRLRRHGWLLVLLVGLALVVLQVRTEQVTGDPFLVPTVILLGSALVPATAVAFVRGRRLPFTVSTGLLAGVAFFSGVLGTVIAARLESRFGLGAGSGTAGYFGAAVVEESAKLLVPLVLLLVLRHRFGSADGLLVGIAAGAGFAVLETMGYAFAATLGLDGRNVGVVGILEERGLLSPAGHLTWTALIVTALYAGAAAGWTVPRVLRLVGAFVLAVVLHGLWDSVGSVPADVVIGVLGLGALGLIAHRIARRARRTADAAAEVPVPA